MKRLMAFAALIMISSPLLKADSFAWTDTGADFYASGTLSATDIGGGVYVANSGSGTATGGIFNDDSLTLWAGSDDGSDQTSPSGLFYFDNELFPDTSSLLDDGGLLFIDNATGGDLNIWGNGAGIPYSTWTEVGGSYVLDDNNSTFTLTPAQDPVPTPEPGSLILLGTGLLVLARVIRRRSNLKGSENSVGSR